ncbi:cytochrome b [Amaricoccus tamworthensis]|uniref:cytochrome b n=1 Tax=Amaricoccus tamworthensis TaxID=57002 RepID=UPI003C7E26FD
MQAVNTTESWGWITRLIHWVMAVLILFQLGMGLYMTNAVDDLLRQYSLTQTHKSWGFVVFVLAVLRIVWRLVQRKSPGRPDDMPVWQWTVAEVTHKILYLMMFIMPLSGWAMSAASPNQDLLNMKNMVFGVWEMPDPWVPGVKSVEAFFASVHWFGALLLTAILLAHAGAAIKHHLINRDDVLKRMTYGR